MESEEAENNNLCGEQEKELSRETYWQVSMKIYSVYVTDLLYAKHLF